VVLVILGMNTGGGHDVLYDVGDGGRVGVSGKMERRCLHACRLSAGM
jgi:hypothetical protein